MMFIPNIKGDCQKHRIKRFSGILHFRIAYAIMPVGNKGYSCSIVSDNKKPEGVRDLRVFLFLFLEREGLTPQAGYQLFIAVQPFDDVVANRTSRDSDDKGYNKFHSKHLPSLPV